MRPLLRRKLCNVATIMTFNVNNLSVKMWLKSKEKDALSFKENGKLLNQNNEQNI